METQLNQATLPLTLQPSMYVQTSYLESFAGFNRLTLADFFKIPPLQIWMRRQLLCELLQKLLSVLELGTAPCQLQKSGTQCLLSKITDLQITNAYLEFYPPRLFGRWKVANAVLWRPPHPSVWANITSNDWVYIFFYAVMAWRPPLFAHVGFNRYSSCQLPTDLVSSDLAIAFLYYYIFVKSSLCHITMRFQLEKLKTVVVIYTIQFISILETLISFFIV